MNGKKVVISFHPLGEFQINIHIALWGLLSSGDGTKDADLPRAKRSYLGGMCFNQGHRIHIVAVSLAFSPGQCNEQETREAPSG